MRRESLGQGACADGAIVRTAHATQCHRCRAIDQLRNHRADGATVRIGAIVRVACAVRTITRRDCHATNSARVPAGADGRGDQPHRLVNTRQTR